MRNDDLEQNIDNETKEGRDFTETQNTMKTQNKAYFDRKRIDGYKYQVGDYVLIKNIISQAGVNKKLLPKYRGPYKVVECLPNERYRIEDIPGATVTSRSYKGSCSAVQHETVSWQLRAIMLSGWTNLVIL